MAIKNITPALIKRVAPYRGPRSSESWNDTIDEIASDINAIITQWNAEIAPLLQALPDGTVDVNLDAFVNGLDGSQIYTDSDATVNTDNGEYWDDSEDRPRTIKETFDSFKSVIDENLNIVSALIADSYSGLTQEQKRAIGLEIFADDYTFTGISIYNRSITNQYNTQQLATDIYGGTVTLTGTGAGGLTNSIKDMLGNLLTLHNGAWHSDASVAHTIYDADIASIADIDQTKIDHSTLYNDSFVGVVNNLEDDLNRIRTLIKNSKGSVTWDVAASPGYVGGPTNLAGHIADFGTGVASATNPHGYALDDITQVTAMRQFSGQATGAQNSYPFTLPIGTFLVSGDSLGLAVNRLDIAMVAFSASAASTGLEILALRSYTGQIDEFDTTPNYGGTPNYATGNLENAIIVLDGQLYTATTDIATLFGHIDSANTFTGQNTRSDTSPAYSSNTYVTSGQSLETAIGDLDSSLSTTDGNVLANTGGLATINALLTDHRYGYTLAVSGGPFTPTLEHWASDIEVEDFLSEFTAGHVEGVLSELNAAITANLQRSAHLGTQSISTLSDHDKSNHDSLNIDADSVDGAHASATPTADSILILDSSGEILNSALKTGTGNGLDADTVDGQHISLSTATQAAVASAGTTTKTFAITSTGPVEVMVNVYGSVDNNTSYTFDVYNADTGYEYSSGSGGQGALPAFPTAASGNISVTAQNNNAGAQDIKIVVTQIW